MDILIAYMFRLALQRRRAIKRTYQSLAVSRAANVNLVVDNESHTVRQNVAKAYLPKEQVTTNAAESKSIEPRISPEQGDGDTEEIQPTETQPIDLLAQSTFRRRNRYEIYNELSGQLLNNSMPIKLPEWAITSPRILNLTLFLPLGSNHDSLHQVSQRYDQVTR